MKTQDINATNQRTNRIRLVMMVAGIVIAILCSLALLYEVPSSETSGSVKGILSISKMVVNDFSIHMVSKMVVSVLWPF